MNPLSRSRLEAASEFIGSLWDRNSITALNHTEYETLKAALDALLNPKVTDEMAISGIKVAFNPETINCDWSGMYKAMIQKLTEDV
jgi:hypothetical protein